MRVAAKTATYGAMHVLVAFLVSWVVSGQLKVALAISMLEPAIQIIFFYFHEHAWNKIQKKSGGVSFDNMPSCCKATADMIRKAVK